MCEELHVLSMVPSLQKMRGGKSKPEAAFLVRVDWVKRQPDRDCGLGEGMSWVKRGMVECITVIAKEA